MQPVIDKQQWLDWIDEQKNSGLSIAAFCRNKAISADNFYYHRGQQRKNKVVDAPNFVRAQLSPEAVAATDTIKVMLGNLVLHLPLDKPLYTAQLLKALQ